MTERERQRRKLIDRLRSQKAEIAQFLQDLDSYNDHNIHGAYIDPARFRADMEARNADLDRMLRQLQGAP